MYRIGLAPGKLTALLLAFVLGAGVAAVPAVAEEAHYYQGEPTDPEGALLKLELNEVDLADHGFDATAPSDEASYESWLDALIALLRQLGLLPPEADTP